MADILIKATDSTHSDPVKDERGCYKRGDIVEAFEDGKMQTPPVGSPFVLVRVIGLTKAQANTYIYSHEDAEGNALKRRKFKIRVDDVPQTIKDQLRDNREVTVTLAQIKSFIRNKVTGLDEA